MNVTTLQNSWGLNNLATDANAFVLRISGKAGTAGANSWNANLCCCWEPADGAAPSDSDYVATLVQQLKDGGWPIDPKRVFGLGESAGEGVLIRSACDHASTWAGIFGFSGTGPLSVEAGDPACSPSEHVSFVHAHGTLDASPEIFSGSPSSLNSGMPNHCTQATGGTLATIDQMATIAGCSGSLALTTSSWADLDSTIAGTETDLYDYTGCPSGYGVELWRMNNSTHTITPTASWETKIIAWMAAHPKP